MNKIMALNSKIPTKTQSPKAYSKNIKRRFDLKELKKYYSFKNIYKLNHPVLPYYEKFLSLISNYRITPSLLINKNIINSCRFFILFESKYVKLSLDQTLALYKKISKNNNFTLNFQYLQNILSFIPDKSKIQSLFSGIDLRNNMNDSRLKIYFSLKIKTMDTRLMEYLNIQKNNFLNKSADFIVIGIDFYFNNMSSTKVYYDHTENVLQDQNCREQLNNHFGEHIMSLINESSAFSVCMKNKFDNKTQFNFSLKNPNKILSLFTGPAIKTLAGELPKIKNAGLKILDICVNKNEISQNNIKQLNVYLGDINQ